MNFNMIFPKLLSCTRNSINHTRFVPYVRNSVGHYNFPLRCLSSDPVKHQNTPLNKEKEKFGMYIVKRYTRYVEYYVTILEKRFPTAVKMYKVFSIGIKDFYQDLKTYIAIRIKLSRDQGFFNISRREIELYNKLPKDMWKIAPILILSAIPFGNYIVFPLALFKPRHLLCSHFWSIQQRAEFSVLELKERLLHNKPLFRALQVQVDSLQHNEVTRTWRKIVGLLGSGAHPTVKEIVSCQSLFTTGPYSLDNITFVHAGCLLQIHGLRKGLFRKKKLRQHAMILQEMDKAILREGGAEKLNTDGLRNACLIRGLNSSHLNSHIMISWLEQWLEVSKVVNVDSYSLLLHCPILLAYNNPQNWVLIY